MKTSLTLTLALILTFNIFSTKACGTFNKKKAEKEAFDLFKKHDYEKALAVFLKLDSASTELGQYDYMIGMCYLSTPSKAKALSYLISASKQEETSFVVNYYLGRALQMENKFEEAIAAYKIYLESLENLGIKFRDEKLSTQANQVHAEKTPELVSSLISQCVAMTPSKNNSVGINY